MRDGEPGRQRTRRADRRQAPARSVPLIASAQERAATALSGRISAAPGLRRELGEPPPWSYPWRLGPGMIAPTGSVRTRGLAESRWAMIEGPARSALLAGTEPAQAYGRGDRPGGRAMHAGCRDGWFCHRLHQLGAGHVLGIDADERNLRRARLVALRHAIGNDRIEFRHSAGERLARLGSFAVVVAMDLGALAAAGRTFAEAAQLCSGVAFLEGERGEADVSTIAELAIASGFSRVQIAHPPEPSDPAYILRRRLMLVAEAAPGDPAAPEVLRP